MRFEMCCFRITPITEIPCSSDSKFNDIANKIEFVISCGIAKPSVTSLAAFVPFYLSSGYSVCSGYGCGHLVFVFQAVVVVV